jgi:hypothetical protein
MSNRAGRTSTIQSVTSAEADAFGDGTDLLKLDSAIVPPRSSPASAEQLNRSLTLREKIARWLEEKL